MASLARWRSCSRRRRCASPLGVAGFGADFCGSGRMRRSASIVFRSDSEIPSRARSAMKKPKTARIIVKGNTDHNLPFLVAIGQLVISWANNESLFLAVLQVLFRDSKTAAITWASHKNSRTRLQFVQALVEEKSDRPVAERQARRSSNTLHCVKSYEELILSCNV